MARQLNLGLLICDTPLPEVISGHGTYLEIFKTHLQKSLDYALQESNQPAGSVDFTLDGYNIVQGAYPDDNKLSTYDGVLITGSAASAYAPLPWIPPLLEFIARVAKEFSNIRILGICFGHQVVARAFGGVCVPNEKGWEVGVYNVLLNSLGVEIFGQKEIRIHQMHRDHVPATSSPPDFEIIGTTPACANQGMVLRYPNSNPSDGLKGIHILTVQGHPEFHESIVSKVIDARELNGVMSPMVVADGRERAVREHDGTGIIGKVMWGVLGVN
ncbi:class I glutamine amidotransferase-like protein [Ceratobasidium sp. AG-Ba]|nr:class I glutamine amidotransferase-like protein [Ceratobasidium sp. AG-Ba]QRW07449.1 class I glutamine amidotransferase-like protein [Ceratobasidium sp. AG-Ba]